MMDDAAIIILAVIVKLAFVGFVLAYFAGEKHGKRMGRMGGHAQGYFEGRTDGYFEGIQDALKAVREEDEDGDDESYNDGED